MKKCKQCEKLQNEIETIIDKVKYNMRELTELLEVHDRHDDEYKENNAAT